MNLGYQAVYWRHELKSLWEPHLPGERCLPLGALSMGHFEMVWLSGLSYPDRA